MTTETLDRRTIGEEVADRLRRRILCGELRPGEALPEAAIAERYATSRPSVRDALRRLAHEGLVQHETHRGARVTSLDADELRDISEDRLVVEPGAALRATFGDEQLRALQACVSRLEKAAEAGNWEAYVDADIEFHSALVSFGAGRRLAEFHARTLRLLRLHLTSADIDDETVGPERPHVGEHRRIVELLAEGDREAAIRLLTRHLEDARNVLG
jgi:DNA-binding GntR family transcriptional regulator